MTNEIPKAKVEDDSAFKPVNRALAEPGPFLARGGVYLLVLSIAGAVIWAATFEASKFVKAEAVVAPVQALPIVQSPYSGTVSSFAVRNGDLVQVGDVLLVLKSEQILELRRELQQRRSEVDIATARLEAVREIELPALAEEAQVKMARMQLLDQLKTAVADRKENTQSQLAKEQDIMRSRLTLAERQVVTFQTLRNNEVVSETRLREAQQHRMEMSGLLSSLVNGVRKAEVDFVEEDKRLSLQSSVLREEILHLEQRHRQLLRDAEAAVSTARVAFRRARDALATAADALPEPTTEPQNPTNQTDFVIAAKAPGQIIESQITNSGQIVQAGATLARIFPQDTDLVVRVTIQNKDISKINLDDEARFKVAAFDYTTHGVLKGIVTKRIPASVGTGAGQTFVAEVTLDQDYFATNGNRQRLIPGMTGMVEIKHGQERLITRFFKPLSKVFEPRQASE